MVTRADVAKRAGTSPALVSYVLNDGPRQVAPATRERILAAIAELGYRPNVAARSLRMARGHALGLVVPDAANPFFAELASAVEDIAFARDYPIVVGNSADDPEREVAYARALIDRQVEGMLVAAATDGVAIARECRAARVPLIAVDRLIDPDQLAHVTVDSVAGSRQATEHLISHGHTRIACLSGPDVSTASDRVTGFRGALSAAGLEPAAVVRRPFGGAAGYAAFEEVMSSSPAPTAVFVTSDLQALGLLRAAYDHGIRVPDDLAVAAFDGIEHGRYTRPGLTTMVQPVRQLGAAAMQALLAEIERGEPAPGIERLDCNLLTRGSCGCPDAF